MFDNKLLDITNNLIGINLNLGKGGDKTGDGGNGGTVIIICDELYGEESNILVDGGNGSTSGKAGKAGEVWIDAKTIRSMPKISAKGGKIDN